MEGHSFGCQALCQSFRVLGSLAVNSVLPPEVGSYTAPQAWAVLLLSYSQMKCVCWSTEAELPFLVGSLCASIPLVLHNHLSELSLILGLCQVKFGFCYLVLSCSWSHRVAQFESSSLKIAPGHLAQGEYGIPLRLGGYTQVL